MGDYDYDYGRAHRRGRRPHAGSSDAPEEDSSGAAAGWNPSANDAEAKRRRRVAGYKAYAVEGKVKASVRQGFRWIKGKCIDLVNFW